MESTIALYSPSRFTFHDGAALSHHHFSNPIDFYFSSSPDCFSSISDIFQCQRFVLERRSLLRGQASHSPKLTLLPCQIKNSLYFFYEINSQSFRRCVSRVREDPFNKVPPLFGHCPNSNYTPPALKRALWGTFFWRDFTILPFLPLFLPFFLPFSLN